MKNSANLILKPYLILLIACLHFDFLQASHVAGADITYQHLSGDSFLVTLNIFRDCDGIPMSSSENIEIFNNCTGQFNVNAPLINPGGTNISQLCSADSLNSTCFGGFLPGMQKYIYQAVVVISPHCSDLNMSWTSCCRNSVLNLFNSTSEEIYINATLNSSTNPTNNSPTFTSQPVPYVCANQLVNYSFGVVEVDGDSLVYSLTPAMAEHLGQPTPLVYNTPYSAIEPITGIVIDSQTGLITFTPNTLGSFVVVVSVAEYDSQTGLLISTVRRDVQFFVINCINDVPNSNAGQITGLTGQGVQTGPYGIELCEGNCFSFTATYNDPNVTDTLIIQGNIDSVLVGAIWSVTGTNPITITIDWCAPQGSAGSNSAFSLFINDGACPILGIQTFVYNINVTERTVAGPTDTLNICASQSAQIIATGGTIFNWFDMSGNLIPVSSSFSCNPCSSPIVSPNINTSYVVVSDLLSSCYNRDTITAILTNCTPPVAAFTANTVNINTSQSVNFTDISSNTPTSWNWTFTGGSPSSSTSQNPSNIAYNSPGCYQVSLTSGNAFGSDNETQICYINVSSVGAAPIASFTANNTNITAGSCVNFTNTSTNNPTSFNWQFPGSGLPTDTSQNVSGVCYNTPGCYAVTLTVSNAFGSDTFTDTCYIFVSASGNAPIAAFTANNVNITTGQSVNFTDLSTNSPTFWSWVFPGGSPGTSSSQNPNNIVYNTPGCYQVSLTVSNVFGGDSETQICYINVGSVGGPVVSPGGTINLCQGDSITLTSSFAVGNLWSTGATGQSIVVNSSGQYFTSIVDTSGTLVSNTVIVNVTPAPTAPNLGTNISQCGGTVTLDGGLSGFNYLWSNNDTSQSIVVNSSGNYSVTVSNACGSVTSNSINVNIQPVTNPAINITGSLLSICANDAVTFDATIINAGSAPIYQWMVNGSPVGSNTAIYSSSTLQDGDVVNCMLTSNDTCASPQSVVSNALTLNVDSILVPAISITSTATNVCTGTLVSFMASATNAGATPTYQWKINGSNVGVNSAGFSSATLANGDVVSCELLSSASCAVPNNASSNNISITVVTLPTPSFTIVNNNLTTAPLTATFTNTTTNAGNADFIWTFGDGSVLADNNPSVNHTYANNGVYNVGLTIQDPALGCAISVFDPNNSAQTIICNVPGGGSCGFTPTTTPTGLTNACLGGNILLSAANYPVGSLLQWNRNGIPLGGEVNTSFNAILPGFYTITATNVSGCAVTSAPVNVNFNLPAQTPPLITVAGGNGFCGQLNATLTATGNFASYVWSTGQTGNSINVNVAGTYFVTGQGAVGCDAVSLPVNIASSLVPTTEICMITVNPSNNFHTVVWEKPLTTEIDSFFVYKEVPYNSSNYSKIAAVAYDSLSEYEDIASNADLNPDRYKISVLDTCGGESAPSNFVRSIHLQVAPGVGTDRFLSWSEYQGQSQNISSYLIYSGSSVANLSVLDSVTAPISYYVDDNPVAGLNTVYRVEAVLSNPCESTRTQFLRSSSNNAENGTLLNPDGIKDDLNLSNALTVQPNPNQGNFEIVLSENTQGNVSWWIEDMMGRRITNEANFSGKRLAVALELAPGLYFVKVKVQNQMLSKKIMVSN